VASGRRQSDRLTDRQTEGGVETKKINGRTDTHIMDDILVVTTFVFIFPILRAAVRAVSLVRPVPLFFSLCRAVWFVMEQIKVDR